MVARSLGSSVLEYQGLLLWLVLPYLQGAEYHEARRRQSWSFGDIETPEKMICVPSRVVIIYLHCSLWYTRLESRKRWCLPSHQPLPAVFEMQRRTTLGIFYPAFGPFRWSRSLRRFEPATKQQADKYSLIRQLYEWRSANRTLSHQSATKGRATPKHSSHLNDNFRTFIAGKHCDVEALRRTRKHFHISDYSARLIPNESIQSSGILSVCLPASVVIDKESASIAIRNSSYIRLDGLCLCTWPAAEAWFLFMIALTSAWQTYLQTKLIN